MDWIQKVVGSYRLQDGGLEEERRGVVSNRRGGQAPASSVEPKR